MSQKMRKLLYKCPWCGRDYFMFVVAQAKPKRYLTCACGMNSYLDDASETERAGIRKGHHAKKR